MEGVEVYGGTNRHDARGINFIVRHIVVPFDMVEIHRLRNPFHLIKVLHVAEEIRIIGDASNVALEMAMIDGIKTDQCHEQPPIGLDERRAEEIALGS